MAWRKMEMHALISALRAAAGKSPGSPVARALARSCAALIYAHWEGFVKESCQCYVDYVAVRRLKFDELNDGLLRTALLGLAKRVMSGDEAGTSTLLELIRRPREARAQLPKNTMVDTRSNLRFDVLCEILSSAGLSIDGFSMKSNFINRSLCDVRNSIAHGRGLFPTLDEIETMHGEVLEMMELVYNMIMSSVRTGDYRWNGQTSSS
jgi:hypothetical protein